MKLQNLFSLIMKFDIRTDEELLSVIDQFGEDYGSIISYLINFNHRFETGEQHEHRKLQLPFTPAKLARKFF